MLIKLYFCVTLNQRLSLKLYYFPSFTFRFLAIWWPLKLQITKRRARFIIFAIWVIALTSTIPWAVFFELVSVAELPPDVKVCLEIWPKGMNGALYFLIANLIACYLLPMALISICYILIWIKVGFCF